LARVQLQHDSCARRRFQKWEGRFCFRLARWRPTSHIGKKLDHRVTRRHSGAFVERATASLLERNAPGRVGEKEVLFYMTKLVGGGVQDFDAIKLLKFGTS